MSESRRDVAYPEAFFERHSPGSAGSAAVILPMLVSWTGAQSVVDVGCGNGTWVRAAVDLGIEDVLGVDGDYVRRDQLVIPQASFRAADLSARFELDRRFDLAVSVEVAEHLPAERAESFVSDLCRLSDVVLFSAAIPGQGGTRHRNEQWPSYWAQLFEHNGHQVFDIVRPRVWNDERVRWWYRQNCFVAASGEAVARVARIESLPTLDVVHPALWRRQLGLRGLVDALPGAVRNAVKKRIS